MAEGDRQAQIDELRAIRQAQQKVARQGFVKGLRAGQEGLQKSFELASTIPAEQPSEPAGESIPFGGDPEPFTQTDNRPAISLPKPGQQEVVAYLVEQIRAGGPNKDELVGLARDIQKNGTGSHFFDQVRNKLWAEYGRVAQANGVRLREIDEPAESLGESMLRGGVDALTIGTYSPQAAKWEFQAGAPTYAQLRSRGLLQLEDADIFGYQETRRSNVVSHAIGEAGTAAAAMAIPGGQYTGLGLLGRTAAGAGKQAASMVARRGAGQVAQRMAASTAAGIAGAGVAQLGEEASRAEVAAEEPDAAPWSPTNAALRTGISGVTGGVGGAVLQGAGELLVGPLARWNRQGSAATAEQYRAKAYAKALETGTSGKQEAGDFVSPTTTKRLSGLDPGPTAQHRGVDVERPDGSVVHVPVDQRLQTAERVGRQMVNRIREEEQVLRETDFADNRRFYESEAGRRNPPQIAYTERFVEHLRKQAKQGQAPETTTSAFWRDHHRVRVYDNPASAQRASRLKQYRGTTVPLKDLAIAAPGPQLDAAMRRAGYQMLNGKLYRKSRVNPDRMVQVASRESPTVVVAAPRPDAEGLDVMISNLRSSEGGAGTFTGAEAALLEGRKQFGQTWVDLKKAQHDRYVEAGDLRRNVLGLSKDRMHTRDDELTGAEVQQVVKRVLAHGEGATSDPAFKQLADRAGVSEVDLAGIVHGLPQKALTEANQPVSTHVAQVRRGIQRGPLLLEALGQRTRSNSRLPTRGRYGQIGLDLLPLPGDPDDELPDRDVPGGVGIYDMVRQAIIDNGGADIGPAEEYGR